MNQDLGLLILVVSILVGYIANELLDKFDKKDKINAFIQKWIFLK